MNRLIHTVRGWCWLTCIALALASCRKEEFMPEPQGNTIPTDSIPSIIAALSPSSHSLWIQAWKKSNIETILSQKFSTATISVLAPDNTALTAAGYTADRIAAATTSELDTLLMYHTLIGNLDPVLLRQGVPLQFAKSLLQDASLAVGLSKSVPGATFKGTEIYSYRHAVQMAGNDLMVDGKRLTLANTAKIVRGWVLPVNQVLEMPRHQMRQWLEADGRFSLFLKALDLISASYEANFNMWGGYWVVYDAVDPSFQLDTKKYYTGWIPNVNNQLMRNTLFAPTDEAFHKAGIFNAEQLEKLNNRFNYAEAYEGKPTLDSMLHLHMPAAAEMDMPFDENWYVTGVRIMSTPTPANTVFHSDILNNTLLGNYNLNAGGGSDKKLNLTFDRTGASAITVNGIDSETPAATITEADRMTLQGPVHVVDRLIIPGSFKF